MKAFQDTLRHTLYGDNPYVVNMKEADVDSVSYDRAEAIYNDRFADASDFTFAIVGNFDPDSVRLYARQYLATLPTVKRDDKALAKKGHTDYQKGIHNTRFEKKQEQPSTTMLIVKVAPTKRTLKNSLSIDILAQALQIRLTETVREEMGAAYSTGTFGSLQTQQDENEYQAVLQTYAPVKPEMTDTSLVVINSELESIAQNGVSDENLAKVKEYMQKAYIESQRENSRWLDYIRWYYTDGLDFNTDYEKTLNNISSKDIQEMASQLLKSGTAFTIIMMPEVEEVTEDK